MGIGLKTTFNEPCFLQKGLMLMTCHFFSGFRWPPYGMIIVSSTFLLINMKIIQICIYTLSLW
jgi:hypothetical protein